MASGEVTGNASTFKSSSEVDNAVEAAQAEAYASSPMTVEGTENGENAIEVTNNEENVVEVADNEESAVEEEVDGGNAAEEREEDNCVDKEKNGENVDEYEGKSEECMVEQEENDEREVMEEKEIEEENKGKGADENEDKQDVVEEEKDEENGNEQNVGRLEANLKQQSRKSRKRTRGKKVAKGPVGKVAPQSDNKPELSRRKKVKKGESDTEQEGNIEENNGRETLNNRENSLDGNKDKNKVAVDVEDGGENVKENNDKKVGESSKKRVINLQKVKRRNNVAEEASLSEGKPGSSNKKNASKKAESMGMIFMCSSKTKQDCYRHKVLGLPASKRNIVEKIYQGMRLFLYDVDLKLLYGIYKAAGRGGYNIEPKAFNSQFPSQVRFKIVEDCLPLAEEKFRKVIKDNYYTRTKFDCQLNSEQVKNLCKLFVTTGKLSRSEKLGRSARAETKKLDRDRIRRRGEVRRPRLREERRQHERPRMRDSPVAPLAQLRPLPPPTTTSSYAYERTLQREAYRQEPPVERRESYMQSRLLDLQDALRQDPYIERRDIYRQEQLLEHHDSYRREPLLEHRDSFRREPLLEHRDSYRREPLLEHSDSYRQERLLEHRDLYRQDVRLEHRDSRLLTLEPRRLNEIESRDLRVLHREHPSYSDLVYSTGQQPPEYHQRVDMPAEGHQRVSVPAEGLSIVYRSTTGLPGLRPEYYSRQPPY